MARSVGDAEIRFGLHDNSLWSDTTGPKNWNLSFLDRHRVSEVGSKDVLNSYP